LFHDGVNSCDSSDELQLRFRLEAAVGGVEDDGKSINVEDHPFGWSVDGNFSGRFLRNPATDLRYFPRIDAARGGVIGSIVMGESGAQ
jgi:hypothetical protein